MFFNPIKRSKNAVKSLLLIGIFCLVGTGKAAANEPLAEADSHPISPTDLAEGTLANFSQLAIPELEQTTEQQPISWQSISQYEIDSQPIKQQTPRRQIPNQQTPKQQDWTKEVYEAGGLEIESPMPNQSAALLTQENRSDEVPPKFGQAGKQRWYIQGGLGTDFDDDLFGLAGAGVSHFFYNGHSINLELNGLAVDQPGNNAVGLNLALLLRSHWIRGENWSIYIDGGAGLLTTTSDVPDAGSSFNFTPQIGGGATFAIKDTQRIMTGLRWYHISNANTFEGNPGLDALYGYVGYNFPF